MCSVHSCATLFTIKLPSCSFLLFVNYIFSVHGSVLSLASNASSSYSSVSLSDMQTQVATAQFTVWWRSYLCTSVSVGVFVQLHFSSRFATTTVPEIKPSPPWLPNVLFVPSPSVSSNIFDFYSCCFQKGWGKDSRRGKLSSFASLPFPSHSVPLLSLSSPVVSGRTCQSSITWTTSSDIAFA